MVIFLSLSNMYNIACVKVTKNENFLLKNNNYILKDTYLILNAQVTT